MDEMQLLRELGDTTPLASAADLAPARARLTAATRPHPRRRRLAVYGVSVVGLAAAVFGVVALVPTGDGGPATASADQILQLAATAALNAPFVTPRPDQFVYLKAKESDGTIREDWLSVDGTHDGIVDNNIPVPGCRNGKQPVILNNKAIPGATEPCQTNPAYRPDLPTDANGMIGYLTKIDGGNLNSTGKDINELFWMSYLRPQTRAALFEAATKIDGLTVDLHAEDVAGRPGIKISWNRNGYSGEFIIDAKTYAYLGSDGSALLQMSIVDKAGH
jgi:hypothetical protein